MEKSLEEKVDELWSREQIKGLTYAYGECILARDERAMANLFTEDGAADFSALGWGIHRGRDAIARHYAGTWPQRVRPFFTNHFIEFIDKDHAKGWCWFDNRAKRGDESLMGCGKLYDDYVRIDGRWYFAYRRVAPFFMVPISKGWAQELD
jgi:hypothetical protein